ncbi:MAG: hypothetical protein NC418_02265 [Muribaculaceae bacterium]|nr:hypothetical protein [Muribaculaceae bacterium]
MTELIILIVLLAVVGFIVASIVRNRGKQSATLEKNMSFNPETDTVLSQSTTPSEFEHKQCALAVTLRIIGVINIFASFIIAMICGNEYGWLIAIVAILSGCLGGLFCYAIAKCVDAADHYLKNH